MPLSLSSLPLHFSGSVFAAISLLCVLVLLSRLYLCERVSAVAVRVSYVPVDQIRFRSSAPGNLFSAAHRVEPMPLHTHNKRTPGPQFDLQATHMEQRKKVPNRKSNENEEKAVQYLIRNAVSPPDCLQFVTCPLLSPSSRSFVLPDSRSMSCRYRSKAVLLGENEVHQISRQQNRDK